MLKINVKNILEIIFDIVKLFVYEVVCYFYYFL